MSAQAPYPTPAPSGASSGKAATASYPAKASYPGATPYPGASYPATPFSSDQVDPYAYMSATPDATNAGTAPFPGTEYVDSYEVFAGGGYTSPKPITNPLARTSLWFAVFSIPGMGITLIISVVLAIIALIRAQELPGRIGTREALAALIYDAFVVFFILTMYALA